MRHIKLTRLWPLLALIAGFQIAGVDAMAQEAIDADAPVRAVKSRAVCSHKVRAGMARCHSQVVIDDAGRLVVNAAPSGYGPSDLRTAYQITGSGDAATVIAVVDAYHYPNAESDLATYRAQYGLPPCTKDNGCFMQVDQQGGSHYPKTDVGWNQETALDLDMVSAMCPNCKILLVEGNSANLSDLAASVVTASTFAGVHAISNSYGSPESGTRSFEPSYDHAGIAVVASAGDSGYGAQFPASSPHVTAVGGTSLKVSKNNARGWAEKVWSGTGSGCSAYYAKPAWQTDTICGMRTVADVAAVADPATGVAVYAPTGDGQSGWQVYGGTSVSSPLIAGIYGVENGPVHYGSQPYANLPALNDVTRGNNGTCFQPYLCNGERGYDGPTGLGTPKGSTAF